MTDLFSSKRVKSFLISFLSLCATALVAIVATPEWNAYLVEVKSFATSQLGLSGALVAVIGLFISELWKNILNKKIAAAQGYNRVPTAGVRGAEYY